MRRGFARTLASRGAPAVPPPCLRDKARGFLESDPSSESQEALVAPPYSRSGQCSWDPPNQFPYCPPPPVPQAPCRRLECPGGPASVSPSGHRPPWSNPGEGSRVSHRPLPHPARAQTAQPRPTPGSPLTWGGAYLSNTAGVVLGLGGGPEQARGCRGRPQLQDPAEVRGVGGGPARGGGRRWRGFLALGGQAELLGGPGGNKGAGRSVLP